MVERISSYGDDEVAPCEEAYKKEYIRKDVRTFGSFEQFDNKFRVNFKDSGKNHRINEEGFIEREFDEEGWFVEVDSLEELMEFKDKYGTLVLIDSLWNYEIPMIEIYDGWRE